MGLVVLLLGGGGGGGWGGKLHALGFRARRSLVCCGGFLARFVVAKVMSLFSSLSPQEVVPPTSESHPATVEHECHECLLLCHTSCQESVARR